MLIERRILMKGLCISLYSETSSFRDPNTHLYQETLPAPSPTSIVGLAGAALGLDYEKILNFFKINNIGIGCIIKKNGFGKDLWGYTKIKSNEVTKDIIIREFFYGVNVNLFFACKNSSVIDKLFEAFNNPCYALTLGNSDDIVKVKSIDIVENVVVKSEKNIKNTWVLGNHIRDFELNWDYIKSIPIKISIKPPVVKNLPIDFIFENRERIAINFRKFTFFEESHLLKSPVEVYSFGDNMVPLFIYNN